MFVFFGILKQLVDHGPGNFCGFRGMNFYEFKWDGEAQQLISKARRTKYSYDTRKT